jgi:glycosyltransferase involved in cell wall biosynthesis
MDVCPLVSVVINCYNGEEFLKEAIDSVVIQDYKNWEIIFWDNCSTDKSAEIVKSYNDSRIRYFRGNKHVLLGEARNYAIEKASGDFIAFLDADDVWMPNKLSAQIKILNKFPEIGLVYSNYIVFSKEAELIFNKKYNDEIVDTKYLIKHYDIGISSVVIRADVIRKRDIKFNINYNLIEEFDYFIRFLCFTKAYYTSSILMRLRKHENNTTKVYDRWHFEYNDFINDVGKKNDAYPGLRVCLRNIRLKSATAEIFYWLNKNNNFLAFRTLFLKIYLSPKLLLYIIPVFIGVEKYNIIHDSIYRLFGKIYPK